MRRLLQALFVVALVVAVLPAPLSSHCCGAESAGCDSIADSPVPEFDSDSHDFGVIRGDSVCSHVFVVRNSGTAPLVLLAAHSGCSCTSCDFPAEPVQPGDSARLIVTFNPSGRMPGSFTKLVRVRTNASPRPHRLYIKGKIAAR